MEELSPSAYVVLGLIARHGPMTPYELKTWVEDSVSRYWPIPHAQLYRDPPRLAERGLLQERAEEHGRRRRVFHLTDAGRDVLERWLADPHTPPPETRNPSTSGRPIRSRRSPGNRRRSTANGSNCTRLAAPRSTRRRPTRSLARACSTLASCTSAHTSSSGRT